MHAITHHHQNRPHHHARITLTALSLSAVLGLGFAGAGSAHAADGGGTGTGPVAADGPTVRPGGPVATGTAGRVAPNDHEGLPTVAELMALCDGADYCEFHPASENISQGQWALAGTAANCAADSQTRTISWTRTEGETNTMGISMSATAGVKGIFEATVEATYGHDWSWEETNSNSIEQTVSPGKAVSIYLAPDRSTVTGQWELHFGDRYKGHYYWYVDNAMVSAPVFQTPWHTRTEEIPANC